MGHRSEEPTAPRSTELLGGGVDTIPLYGTGTTMFEESPEWHAHYFDQALAVGFRNVKVRLGKHPDDDVELVRVVQEHVGPERGSWPTPTGSTTPRRRSP